MSSGERRGRDNGRDAKDAERRTMLFVSSRVLSLALCSNERADGQ